MAIVATVGLPPGSVRLVRADGERIAYEANYTYVVDPAAGAVRVTVDVTLTNVVPNRTDSRGVLKTYFTGFAVPLPDESTNVVVTQDGTALTVVHGAETPADLYSGEITFVDDLFYNQHARLHVTYDLIASAPRSEEPTRGNAAYVAFDAFGVADPGRLTVDVVMPISYEAAVLGAAMDSHVEGGNVVYSATDFSDEGSFDAFVVGRDDRRLVTEEHAQAGASFVVRAWPDDTEWRAFVEDQIDRGVPALITLIGQPWQVGSPADITEAATNKLFGYAGWYDSVNRRLEIGEELDSNTMLHELSHAWFNDDWFDGRWINEGLAQAYADRADQQLGEAAIHPPKIDDALNSPLNTWAVPLDATTDEGQQIERIGYNASWYVVDQLVDSLGEDKMREVFAAVAGDEIAYVGDAAPETVTGIADWKRLLDYIEQRDASAGAEDLFRSYVVTDAQRDDLDERDAARTAYTALVDAGRGWAAPVVVRRSMAGWEFDDASTEMTAATDVLTKRDTLTSTLDELQVPIDPTIEATYEAEAVNFDATTAVLAAQQTIAERVTSTHDRAIAAVTAQGRTPTPALEATLRAGASLASEQAAADEVIATATSVEHAADAAASPRSLIDRVGLYGADVDQALDEARDALASGDTAAARAEVAEVESVLADAGDVGGHRVLIGALTAGALLGLFVLVFALRRRRTRRAARAIGDGTVPNTESSIVSHPATAS